MDTDSGKPAILIRNPLFNQVPYAEQNNVGSITLHTGYGRLAKWPIAQASVVQPPMMSARGIGLVLEAKLTRNPASAPQEIVNVPSMAEAEPKRCPWSASAIAAELGPTKPWQNMKLTMHNINKGKVISPVSVNPKAQSPAAIMARSAQGNSLSGRCDLSSLALICEPRIRLSAFIPNKKP